MKYYSGRNKQFRESMNAIHDYLYDDHGNSKDKVFNSTIFPMPEIIDYSLSKRVQRWHCPACGEWHIDEETCAAWEVRKVRERVSERDY